MVGDRESDIYSCFAGRSAGVDLIFCAAQDRAIERAPDRPVVAGSLFASAAAWPDLTCLRVKVAPRRVGDPAGSRQSPCGLARLPSCCRARGSPRPMPTTMSMTLVETREINPATKQEPLHWRLLTSLEVGDADAACEIVRLYRLRWRIEGVFRALKSDGMRLKATQMHRAERLFKVAVVGLAAACRTIQLVDARNGRTRPATDVIDAALLSVAGAIGPRLEGNTERQKNPHPSHSLAWLAWIIARLGGWNCYYKPPGPKTMRAGWRQFETMPAGFAVAMAFRLKSNPRIPQAISLRGDRFAMVRELATTGSFLEGRRNVIFIGGTR